MYRTWPMLFAGAAVLAGCDFTHEPDLEATAPGLKIPAIVRASDPGEARELAELVQSLDDADPAVRLFAGQALKERTGQDFGYDPYATPEDRQAAIARWRLWLGGGNPSKWQLSESHPGETDDATATATATATADDSPGGRDAGR